MLALGKRKATSWPNASPDLNHSEERKSPVVPPSVYVLRAECFADSGVLQ